MFRLFKAAARSLRNIKTTVTGLTILIFLTSAIFTLLSDVRSAYNQKFDEYEQVSRLHDVTLDLDVNNEGTLPNGAYTQDLTSNYNSQSGQETYMEVGTEGFQTTVLSQGYQPIDSFTTPIYAVDGEEIVSEGSDGDITEVFNTSYLVEDYQLWKTTVARDANGIVTDKFDSESLYAWDLDTFSFTPRESDQFIDRYELKDGSQELMFHAGSTEVGQTVTTHESIHHFENLFNVHWYKETWFDWGWPPGYESRWWTYWEPIADMYINMETNVLAVNSGTGIPVIQNWLNEGVAYKLDMSIKEDTSWVRHLFGFLDVPFRTDETMTGGDGSWIHMHNAGHWLYYNLIYNYKLDLFASYKNPNQLLMDQSGVIDWRHGNWGYEQHTSFTYQPENRLGNNHGWSAAESEIPMADSFVWPSSFGDVSFAHQASKAVLEHGTTYHVPQNWTGNIKAETIYTKNTFEITDTNEWTGSYKSWWDSLTIEEQDALSTFEYWTKSVIKEGYPTTEGEVDPNGEFFGVVLTTDVEKNIYEFTYTDTGDIVKEGTNTNLLVQGSLTHPDIDRQEFITQFNAMTNNNKESENLAIISEGATNFTRLSLEETATELVGEENIGRRTTMTISSFDTTANRNQVFHFVNASQNVVWNEETNKYESNVGKMYYEELSPTALLYLDSTQPANYSSEPFSGATDFQFRQPPASYVSSMIASIFRGYHISDEYFSVDVDYLEYAGEERQFVKLDAVDDPSLETTTGESLYLTQIGDAYHILQLVGEDLVPVIGDSDNPREFTYSEVHALIDGGFNSDNSNGFYLSGQINQTNGWYKISSVNKNLIIPVEYRNLPTTAIERAVNDDEYDVFVSAIRQSLEGILSVGANPWVSNEVMTYLTYGVEAAMEENYFYTVMESGYIDKSHLGKIVFDALYLADQRHTQPILNRLFTDFIDHMKIELNTLSTEEERKATLKSEISNLTTLFEDVFHLTIPFDVSEYIDYTEDVNMLLDGFGDILASVNTDKWLSGIRSWYDENYDGIQPKVIGQHDGANLYNYFGSRELLTPLFSNQDGTSGAIVSVALTGGINKVIESLDFEMVMEDIITAVTDTLNTPSQAASIRNVFEMMGVDSEFSNVKEGLQNIISKLDASKMMDNISRAFNSRDYIFTKEVNGEIWAFKTSYVTELEAVSAIMGGIFSTTSDHLDIVDYIVDMFNLSGKVEDVWLPSIPVIGPPDTNLVKPGNDDTALDLYDLQSLEMMSYSTLEQEADFMQSYYNAPDSEVNKRQAAEILSDRYGVEIEWDNDADMKKYSDLYQTVMNKGYSLSQYNSNSNIQNDLNGEVVNGNLFSMADNTLWTFKHRWKDLGAMGYSSDGAGEQAYQAVSEVTNSSNMAAGANSFVMWGYYFELIDMITKDLMESGQSYDTAIRNAFTEVWAIITAAQSDPTLQRSEDVDDGKTTVSIVGVVVSETGPTTGSSVAIRPEDYTSILTPNTGEVPTTFQTGYARLKEVSPTFAEVTAANPDQFIRHMGLVAWSYSKKGLYDNWGSESTATGAETYRYYWALYHFIGYGPETSWKQILYQGEEQLDAMMSFTDEFSQQTKIFDMLGLNTTVASTYMGVLFPGVAKGSTIAYLQGDREGNIEYVVRRELDNLAGKGFDGWKNDLGDYFDDTEALPFEVESHGGIRLDLNMYQLQHTIDQMRESGSDTFFDLNISDLYESTIYSATEVHTEENQIRFMNIGAYVAKVSESYMLANGKKAYGSDSSHVPIEQVDNIDDMVTLIETIDPAYTINVNNQKFLILGRETTVDYMYPVLDEANINVDTANQAVVFVNDYGFERVFQANQSTAVKDYLILSTDDFNGVVVDKETGDIINPTENALPLINQEIDWNKHFKEYEDNQKAKIFLGNDEGLKEALNYIVETRIESNQLQKAYLATESDPINPERSMRVTTIQGVIDSVSQLQFYGVLILMTLVGLVTIFIAGRYVETRRVVIGILRAQGYSKHRIALSFIVFGVVTATVGGVAGYLTGHFLQIPLMEAFTTFWTVPTEPYTFSYISLVTSVVAPIVGLSVLIIAASLFILRSKPTELMSGAAEASTGSLQRFMIKPFKKFSIVTRFRTTLALGSFFKMMALAMTFALTATVALFTLGSVGVFDRALAGTYDQRDYEYATDLFTPTLEGGGYDVVDKNNQDDLNQLYIPMGNNQESATHYWDYFKPGHSRIMDLKYYEDIPGGESGYTETTPEGKAHILTKSSLDLTIDSAIAANPWELAKNSMPDSQYVSALNITAVAAVQMMFEQFDPSWTTMIQGQEVNAKNYYWDQYQYYVENTETDSNGNMIDPYVSSGADKFMDTQYKELASAAGSSVTTYYYHYQPSSNNDGTFLEYVFNHATGRFDARPISTTEASRERYRTFLTQTYQNEDIQDYTMIYGGVNIDETYDETYSWAEVTIDGNSPGVSSEKVKMTGVAIDWTNENDEFVYTYDSDSLVKPVTERDEDIKEILARAMVDMKDNIEPGTIGNPYPIAPNEVVSRRWGLNVGHITGSDVFNTTDRYLDETVLPEPEYDDDDLPISNTELYFEVVAINSTYINTEIITDQSVVNKITGMDLANWREGVTPFNGVMSDNEVPQQAIESLLLYSQSGYWGATDSFQFPMSSTDVLNNANQIFGDVIDNNTGLMGSMRSATYIDASGNETPVYSEESLDAWVASVDPGQTYQGLVDNINLGLTNPDDPSIDQAFIEQMLRSYTGKYGNTIYSSAISGITAQNTEAGFVTNITHTVSTLVNASVVVTLVVSIIILIIISTMIVNENKKKIATFAVMGYSEWEKIRMFLFVYTPFILLGIGAAIPVAYGMVAVFNAVVLTTSNMALPLALTWWHILIATIITTVIISATVSVAYRAIRNIKPIYILQGDD